MLTGEKQRWWQRLHVNREIRIGDLLTMSTVIVSVVSVLFSWSIDRSIRLTKEADTIREAAANTLGDLERWRHILVSVFDDAQPIFVEISQIAADAKNISNQKMRVESARDILWRRLHEMHNLVGRKILDEKLENGYVRMLNYYPDIRTLYQNAITSLRKIDERMMSDFLNQTQISVMSFREASAPPQSVDIGNSLRQSAGQIKVEYTEKIEKELTLAKAFLVGIISADDSAVLGRRPSSLAKQIRP